MQRTLSRRAALAGLTASTAVFGLGLSGCSAEPKQRKAFIEFLQTRVLSKTKLAVPVLNDKDKQDLGDYAKHYELIYAFHREVNAIPAFESMKELSNNRVLTLPMLMDKRAALQKTKNLIKPGVAQLQAAIDKANKDKGALSQPDELKPVYDAAFKKLVEEPGELALKLLPALDRMLTPTMELLALVDENPKGIVLRGQMVEVNNQALLNRVNGLIQKVQTESQDLAKLESQLRGMAGLSAK